MRPYRSVFAFPPFVIASVYSLVTARMPLPTSPNRSGGKRRVTAIRDGRLHSAQEGTTALDTTPPPIRPSATRGSSRPREPARRRRSRSTCTAHFNPDHPTGGRPRRAHPYGVRGKKKPDTRCVDASGRRPARSARLRRGSGHSLLAPPLLTPRRRSPIVTSDGAGVGFPETIRRHRTGRRPTRVRPRGANV